MKRIKINTLSKIKGNIALTKSIKKSLEKRIKALRREAESRCISILASAGNDKLNRIQRLLNDLSKKYESSFDKLGKELSKQMMDKVVKQIDTHFIKINKNYAVKTFHEKVKLTKDVIISENINLIKSIPGDILNKYDTILKQSILTFNKESIIKQFKSISKISQNRAELIARDQTAKALERYHSSRAESLGFKYYVWSTSRDERVSKGEGGHKSLEGRIYKYDNPTAIIDSNGTIGVPAQRVNCRCTALPLVTEDTDKLILKKDSKHGNYYILQ